MLPHKLFFWLLFISGVPLAIAIGYYYYTEVAPICTYEYAEQFQVNRYCQCKGFEVQRHNSLETDGYKETICIGQIQDEYCKIVIRGETFSTDCEE